MAPTYETFGYIIILALTPEGKGLLRRRRRRGGYNMKNGVL